MLCIASGLCAACMLARVEQERLESLKYERATIYIKCIDDNEDSKTENNSEVNMFSIHYLFNMLMLIDNCQFTQSLIIMIETILYFKNSAYINGSIRCQFHYICTNFYARI